MSDVNWGAGASGAAAGAAGGSAFGPIGAGIGAGIGGLAGLFGGGGGHQPDYMALAQQQTQANRPDQQTPFGFSNWSQDANGNWNQQTGFSPELAGTFSNLAGQANANSQHGIGTGQDAFNQAQGAAWGNAQQNLLPQLQQHFDAQQSQLVNSGADVGNPIYNSGMQNANRDYNAGLAGAWGQSMQQGLNAQNMTYQQNKDAYTTPFSLMGGMQNMLQMPGVPGAGNYQQAGSQQFAQNNQNNQNNADMLSGLGDLGVAAGNLWGQKGKTPFSFGQSSGWGQSLGSGPVQQGSGDFSYGP